MTAITRIADIDLTGKRVLIRADLNVPMLDGKVSSDARIQASLATVEYALAEGAQVIVMSHLGRPEEGVFDETYSLRPVAAHMAGLLGREVGLLENLDACTDVGLGELALLENVRFLKGEKTNADALAQAYAAQCDVFVHDAFGTAHRAQASTHGVVKFAPEVCAGLLLSAELDALDRALTAPAKPMFAIVGGSKVSTKLEILHALADNADEIIVGGGIANTFIAAQGHNVGQSLHEADLVETAREIAARVEIPIPVDVMVARAFTDEEPAVVRLIDEVGDEEMILDIGPRTARAWADRLEHAGTILWNGPLGVFEFDQFGEATRVIAEAVAQATGFSIAGGGDTLAAIDKYGMREGISYISTGGGAFLEFVEGKVLPAVEILETRGR